MYSLSSWISFTGDSTILWLLWASCYIVENAELHTVVYGLATILSSFIPKICCLFWNWNLMKEIYKHMEQGLKWMLNSHIVYFYQKHSQIVYWTKHDLDLVVECFRTVRQDSKSTVHHQNTHVDLKRTNAGTLVHHATSTRLIQR